VARLLVGALPFSHVATNVTHTAVLSVDVELRVAVLGKMSRVCDGLLAGAKGVDAAGGSLLSHDPSMSRGTDKNMDVAGLTPLLAVRTLG